MANNLGGLLQRMNDIAAHGDAINKWARMTEAQHWAAYQRNTAGASPPYALPPYVFTNAGPMLDALKVRAEARNLYKRRSPWGFLIDEVFLNTPPDTALDEVVITRPGANMSAFRYAEYVVSLRILAEEQVDFPNNLDAQQLARVHALDPTGKKTARARERQAASNAVHQKIFGEAREETESTEEELLARAEAKLAEGDVVGYWTILAEQRPLAGLALRIVQNQGLPSQAANDRLQLMAVRIFGEEFSDAQIAAIRLKVAGADLKLREEKQKDGHGIGLTSDEVIRYHKKVFEGEELPKLTFAPEAFAKVMGPLWSVVLDANTEEVIEDGVVLTYLKVYGRELAQAATDPVTFVEDWVEVMQVASESSPTLVRYLQQSLDAAHEAMIDLGQKLIEEPKRLVSRDTSLDDPVKDHSLAVYYDYSNLIGHFFVELRSNKNEKYFFGKYPSTSQNQAEMDATHPLSSGVKPSDPAALQLWIRDFAKVLYGPGVILSGKDKRRLVEIASDQHQTVGRPVSKIPGAKSQISKAEKDLKLTKKEFEDLKKKLGNRQSDPRNYVLTYDHCATFVQEVLGNRASLEEMFPLNVRIQSLAGLYVSIFGGGIPSD